MKRVIIHGCYNTGNYGDLLLMDLVHDHLQATCGIHAISPWISPAVADNIHARPGHGIRDCFGADAAIFGGGGYLTDGANPTTTRRLLKYMVPAVIWRLTGVPYVVVGVGAGPDLAGKGARRVRTLCRGARAICVRDVESFDCLVRAGVPSSDIEVTADMVLGMTRDMIPDDATGLARETIGSRTPGVRRLGLHVQGRIDQKEELARIIKTIGPVLRDREDIAPVIFFDNGRRLIEFMRSVAAEHLPRARVLETLPHWPTAALIGELDGLITTKLHTGITAWTFGIPSCGYSVHHGKTRRFYAQIGRSEFQGEFATDVTMVADWARCFAEDPEAFAAEDPVARRELPRLARRNYEVIDEHLGGVLGAKQTSPAPRHKRSA